MKQSLGIAGILTFAGTLGACSGINLDPIAETPAPVQSIHEGKNDGEVSDANPYACELTTVELGTSGHTPLNAIPTPGATGEAAAAVCRLSGYDCAKIGIRGQYQTEVVTGVQTETIQGSLVCQPGCTGDADCPAADSGTSTPLCWMDDGATGGICYLPCDGAADCPAGFECRAADEAPPRAKRCVQPLNTTLTFTYPPAP